MGGPLQYTHSRVVRVSDGFSLDFWMSSETFYTQGLVLMKQDAMKKQMNIKWRATKSIRPHTKATRCIKSFQTDTGYLAKGWPWTV